MKMIRLLANLGYGSRRDVQRILARRRVTSSDGHGLGPKDDDPGGLLLVDAQPLDPRPPLTLVMHKPLGVVCTRANDEGRTVYDLLPGRFAARKPILSPVGRLDKDTTGLLLFTDDGALLHHLTSPRHHVPRTYRALLAQAPGLDDIERLAAGTLRLRGEATPLEPATVLLLGPREVRVTVIEGRYHLVRRMWAALGNRVLGLHRERIGALDLGDLAPGDWGVIPAANEGQRFPSLLG
ncbi:MAG: rRNA pseudouridine synthase [Oligoflexia bacterium]|nr:rRNA pseudouridine synthase [Oligoflexia bacterium]